MDWYRFSGTSDKMILLAVVLVLIVRYLNPFGTFLSAYYTEIKIFYVCLTYTIVLFVYSNPKFIKTYENHLDSFRIEFVICAILCLALVYNCTAAEVFWTSSRYVEAAVVWPHFVMVNKSKQVRTVVFVYFAALGLYRLIYIADWGYKYYMSDHYDLLPVIPGSIHPLVFWILCLTKVVTITNDKKSWFGKNLTQSDTNGIFVIQVPGGFDSKDGKLVLIDHCEDADQEVATLTQKQEMPPVHKT
ncbi:ER lumen protein-retaining receptor 1-B-like isoform X2 [Zophobas morio]|uniref:ER lumen protein-retaining receptor 1-B-like isoform X2 n=1 Tax=Zophobas morio TaxID=2755281 RepID=UPI003083225F